MTHRRFIPFTLLLFTVFATAQMPPITEIGTPEGQVSILAEGYIEDGTDNPLLDWVTDFETQTDCKVILTNSNSSDDMVNLMETGEFDLVTASGDASLRLIEGGLVQAINTDLVPNWAMVDSQFLTFPTYVVNNVVYGVPYQWGINYLAYNTEVFPEPPTSWEVVFKEMLLPDGLSNKGRVQAYYGPIYMADAALYLKFARPDLNITDPYALDKTQYEAVLDILRDQYRLVNSYWNVGEIQYADFEVGLTVASSSWPFQVNQARANNLPIAGTVPFEGATGWVDATMLYTDSLNPNCAYLWLNHSLELKVQGDVAASFGSVPVVSTACLDNTLLGEDGCTANGYDYFDSIYFWRIPTTVCRDARGNTCIPYSQWVADYRDIQNGN